MDSKVVGIEEDGPSREEWPARYFSQVLHELSEWKTGNQACIETFHLESEEASKELGECRVWNLVIRWSDGTETHRQWRMGGR
jgi:hypothetical protein